MAEPISDAIQARAAINKWVTNTFPKHRMHLSHSFPKRKEGKWLATLMGNGLPVSNVEFDVAKQRVYTSQPPSVIVRCLESSLREGTTHKSGKTLLCGQGYEFRLGNGIAGVSLLDDREIDLLLTDPPYGISKSYNSENQVPRRLRKNGRDFIMPKGNFGAWDKAAVPEEWLREVLPKVGGWFVSFCAQAQIGEYMACLEKHRFVAVGTLVWQKTNPVPFNHRFKPINAWEALVVGKRPGTRFNGSLTHNVFVCKSPSPQKRYHRTQKPLQLMEEFVGLFSSSGDLVFDPFAGSGTTLVAASGMGRRAVGYENSPEIFSSACDRIEAWEASTKK